MAEVTKKYLDKTGLETLIAHIKAGDTAALNAAKTYADSLADNYEEAGAVSTAKTELEEAIAAAEEKIAANTRAISDEKTRAEGKEGELTTAVEAAQAAANKAQGDVNSLKTYVGTIPEDATATDVIGYVQEKTSGIASEGAMTELANRVTQAEKDIDAIEADYLKAADKTELQTGIDDVSAAVDEEVSRAKGVESGLRTDVDAIKADYLKVADKTELKEIIDTNKATLDAVKEDVDAFFLDADFTENAKDTLKEIQTYIDSDATAAAEMTASIKKNADAITAVEGRVNTLETEMDAVEKKATDNESAIAELKTAVGEGGSVAEQIKTAVDAEKTARETAIAGVQTSADKGIADAAAAKAAADKAQGEVDALELVVAGKADGTDLTALTERVATNETNIAANTSAIAAFTPITVSEIQAMFA